VELPAAKRTQDCVYGVMRTKEARCLLH
jgi:hypothetical protein